MPELPEVQTVARTLKNFVLNQKIEEIIVYHPRTIEGDVSDFTQALKGQMIIDIQRKGKYLIFILEKDCFLSHLRMEGKYLYEPSLTPLEKHSHVVFRFSNGMDLRYHDTRKFGRMQRIDKMNYEKEPPLSLLGKEPFELTAKEFYDAIHTSSLPIKSLLLDQTKIAGLGNIYANEVLFKTKIHPMTKGNALSLNKCQQIIDGAIVVLNEAIAQGGTTIRSFSSNGIHGLFTQQLCVHNKEGEPCINCGHDIIRKKINGRSAYYCPICQKKSYQRKKKVRK